MDLSTTAGRRANPRIVVDPSGNVTAVWGTFAGTYGIQTATLAPGGTWTAPVDLSAAGGDTFDTPQIAVDRQGTATAVWQRHDGSGWIVTSATRAPVGAGPPRSTSRPPAGTRGTRRSPSTRPATPRPSGPAPRGRARVVQASRRHAGGRWSDSPVDLTEAGTRGTRRSPSTPPATPPRRGHATTARSWTVHARGLDAAGPVVTDLDAPANGSTGRRAYSVAAYDVWSRVASATWRFADGTTATGTSVTHADGGDGTRPVRVTLIDRVGNATAAPTRHLHLPSRSVAPVITRAVLTRHKIRARRLAQHAARKATARSPSTNAAKVTLVFRRQGTGDRSG